MAKSITATLVKTIQNPYATQANGRPPYLAEFSFPQPQPPGNAPVVPTGTPVDPPVNPVIISFELTAAELSSLTPGCTVVFTSGAITPVVLPAS